MVQHWYGKVIQDWFQMTLNIVVYIFVLFFFFLFFFCVFVVVLMISHVHLQLSTSNLVWYDFDMILTQFKHKTIHFDSYEKQIMYKMFELLNLL